jgi:hypothetical protein
MKLFRAILYFPFEPSLSSKGYAALGLAVVAFLVSQRCQAYWSRISWKFLFLCIIKRTRRRWFRILARNEVLAINFRSRTDHNRRWTCEAGSWTVDNDSWAVYFWCFAGNSGLCALSSWIRTVNFRLWTVNSRFGAVQYCGRTFSFFLWAGDDWWRTDNDSREAYFWL